MRTIAVINQKGGVGKTTTVANVGAAIAAAGRDVCLLDMDPQAHLTLSVGIEPGSTAYSMYDVLAGDRPLAEAVVQASPRLWVGPALIDLAAAEMELAGTVGREQILRDRLADLPRPYDFTFIDCPPSLGLLTLNALAAADDVIIPLQPHFLALQGLGKLLETISLVQRRINPNLRVRGVVLCLYESGTRLAAEVIDDLRNFLQSTRGQTVPWTNATIFQTPIRRNVKLAECPSFGKTIFDYEPRSHGASDYQSLAQEILALYQAAPVQPAAEPVPAIPPASPASSDAPAQAVPPPAAVEAAQAVVTDVSDQAPSQDPLPPDKPAI